MFLLRKFVSPHHRLNRSPTTPKRKKKKNGESEKQQQQQQQQQQQEQRQNKMHPYPPNLSPSHSLHLLSQIKDWQLTHGSVLKIVQSETENTVLSYPVSVSVFPTLFPRRLFQQALDVQTTYNELYAAVAEDEEWLWEVTKELIPVEPLAAALWGIYWEVKERGCPAQSISAGIFRSDYMLCRGEDRENDPFSSNTTLKQVEFNTYSCAGGAHANNVVDMHRSLVRMGAYKGKEDDNNDDDVKYPNPIQLSALPPNNTINGLASCLAAAHAAYGPPKSGIATETAVLFIVQPYNFNIADERPIEYALWNSDPAVPAYRLDFGPDVLEYTSLTESTGGDGRELLFHPPWLGHPVEISVIYMRAGYEAEEYTTSTTTTGRQARLRLEISRAIKCPSLLSHISTFKKVQQALSLPGALERWLPSDKAARIRETFVPMYPLDDLTPTGVMGRKLATTTTTATGPKSYILKPSLEGGGHNVYGEDIPAFLASIPQDKWSSYILMERICPPRLYNVLLSSSTRGVCADEVVSELGVFGTCLWGRRRRESSDSHQKDSSASEGQDKYRRKNNVHLLANSVGGWSFKTKDALVDEMSVVKGYGCFDTPCLV
jgi:glutathione synthetase